MLVPFLNVPLMTRYHFRRGFTPKTLWLPSFVVQHNNFEKDHRKISVVGGEGGVEPQNLH